MRVEKIFMIGINLILLYLSFYKVWIIIKEMAVGWIVFWEKKFQTKKYTILKYIYIQEKINKYKGEVMGSVICANQFNYT